MKKLTITFLSVLLLAAFSITTSNAQTLGERVSDMQNKHKNESPTKNRDYDKNRNRDNPSTWDDKDYDRRRNSTYPTNLGKHKGWYKHNNGKHKGWYKNNNGHGRKDD